MRRFLLAMPLLLVACPDGQEGSASSPGARLAQLKVSVDPIHLFLEHGAVRDIRVKNVADDQLGLGFMTYASIEGDVTAQATWAGALIASQEERTFGVVMTGHALGAFSGTLSLDSDHETATAMLRGRVAACPKLELGEAYAVATAGASRTATATLSNGSEEDFAFHVGTAQQDFEVRPRDGVLRAGGVQPLSVVHVVGDRLSWAQLDVVIDSAIECSSSAEIADAPRELDCLSAGSVAFCVNVSARSVFVDAVSLEGEGTLRPIEVPARVRPGESLNPALVDAPPGAVIRIEWRTPDEARDPIRVVF